MSAAQMRIDGYYWVKHPRYGWHVACLKYGEWLLSICDPSVRYSETDFLEISSRIRDPDEQCVGA